MRRILQLSDGKVAFRIMPQGTETGRFTETYDASVKDRQDGNGTPLKASL
jgi:hypothetical protein